MKLFRLFLPFILGLNLLFSCKEIDCPLDNIVVMTIGLYDSETLQSLTLEDTLTVKASGTDSILLNRALGVNSIQLPIRQGSKMDTLMFCFSNKEYQIAIDTIFLGHTNEPHFESIDCPPSVFHTITHVSWTSHPLSKLPLTIDSVAVARTKVNYDDVENLKVYLRSTVSQ